MTENRLYEIIDELSFHIKSKTGSLDWIFTDTSISQKEIDFCCEVARKNKETKIPIEIGGEYKVVSDFYDNCNDRTVIVLASVKNESDLYQCAFANDYKKNPDDFWLSNGEVKYSENKVLLLYDFELRRIQTEN